MLATVYMFPLLLASMHDLVRDSRSLCLHHDLNATVVMDVLAPEVLQLNLAHCSKLCVNRWVMHSCTHGSRLVDDGVAFQGKREDAMSADIVVAFLLLELLRCFFCTTITMTSELS